MRLKEQLELQSDIEVPWHVWTKFGSNCKVINLVGEYAFLSKDGDSGSLQDLQKAIEWYAEQLGGKVKWEK